MQGGVSYLFSPKHRIGVDLLYGDVAPAAEDVFVSVEYRNRTIDHPRPTNRLGGEVTYRFSGRLVGFEVRGYLLSTRGENTVRQYYDDVASVFSDMVITDMDKLYAGVELGCDITLTDRFALRTAFSIWLVRVFSLSSSAPPPLPGLTSGSRRGFPSSVRTR